MAYKGVTADAWSVSLPPAIVNSVYFPIIYNYYIHFPNGTNTFLNYLKKFGASDDDRYHADQKIYLTNYKGVQNFAFSEGIIMRPIMLIDGAYYFNELSTYRISVGLDSDIENEYFHVHDKVVGDLFDANNGAQYMETTVASRAFYGESHWYWGTDECWMLYPSGVLWDYDRSYRPGSGYKA